MIAAVASSQGYVHAQRAPHFKQILFRTVPRRPLSFFTTHVCFVAFQMKFAQGADSLRAAAGQAKRWILAHKLLLLALLVVMLGMLLQWFKVV